MIYFLNNGKLRFLHAGPANEVIKSWRQELKLWTAKKGVNIQGFKPLGEAAPPQTLKVDVTNETSAFTIVAVVRTRKGYRLAAATFSVLPFGKMLSSDFPEETPSKALQRLRSWEVKFKGLVNNEPRKRIKVSSLLKDL